MKLIALTLAALFLTPPAAAADLAKCRPIKDTAKRLACYDAESAPARPEVKPADEGKWQTLSDVSMIDDSKTVVISLLSENTAPGQYSLDQPKRGRLMVRCLESQTSIILTFNEFLGSQQRPVTYRVDKAPAKTVRLQVSADHQAVGWWNGEQAIPLAKQLMNARRLVIRLTPYGESPKTFEFYVDGLMKAIKPLRAACNW